MARDLRSTGSSLSGEADKSSSSLRDYDPSRSPAANDWRTVMRNLISEHDKNVCPHEETHRGGLLWTICDQCGKRWADDQGGFKAYEEPAAVTAAWAILAQAGEPEQPPRLAPKPALDQARPLDEWTEEDGNVLWWVFPITEAPYCGSPLDVGRTCEITLRLVGEEHVRHTDIGGWPGYHTHWTPIPYPDEPPAPCDGSGEASETEGLDPKGDSAVGESRGAHE